MPLKNIQKYEKTQWLEAQTAVLKEYDLYLASLREKGVDYTIEHSRQLIVYQDLVAEWRHKLPTLIVDLEDNPLALTIFADLAKDGHSHLLGRCYDRITSWVDYEPSPLSMWLELEEDYSI